MIRQQRWIPDNCSGSPNDACSFIEEWDDTVNVVSRQHSFVKAEHLCTRHAAMYDSDHSAAFIANYEENRRKNITWTIALALKSTLALDQYKWSFDNTGLLTVNFGSALTTNQKTQLQSNCNLQFGLSKVIIQ